MSRLAQALKDNRWTCLMVVFVMGFYLYIFAVDYHEKKHGVASLTKTTASIVSTAEIKKKEEVFMRNTQGRPLLISTIGILFILAIFCGFVIDTYLLKRNRYWLAD